MDIKYLDSQFKNIELVLIADDLKIIKKARKYPVQVSRCQLEAKIERPLNSSNHDLTYKKGFWRYSMERIIGVTSYIENIQESDLKDTFHIERQEKVVYQIGGIFWTRTENLLPITE